MQEDDQGHDPDRDFARTGGAAAAGAGSGYIPSPPPGQHQQSTDHAEYRDSRPNPNKHEDGYVSPTLPPFFFFPPFYRFMDDMVKCEIVKAMCSF